MEICGHGSGHFVTKEAAEPEPGAQHLFNKFAAAESHIPGLL